MKYQIIKNGQDDYTLKYKDKVINFHSDVEIVSELQRINELGKEKLIFELAEKGKTISELTKEIKKDGKTYYDNSNRDELIKIYAMRVGEELFNKGIEKMLNMKLINLVEEIGLETKEEIDKFSTELGEVMVGRFRG